MTKKELKAAVATEEVKHPNGAVEQNVTNEGQAVYEQPTCNVGMTMGVTLNTGNFNNVKISVSLFVPCYPNEVDDMFDVVQDKLDERLSVRVDEIKQVYGIV